MKKNLLIAFFSFIFFTTFKTNYFFTDYRDNFVGDYFCNSKCKVFDNDTIRRDTLSISISKDLIDSILKINIGSSLYLVKLNDTILHSYPLGGHQGGYFFSLDSVSFSINIGVGKYCIYRGKKY